MRQDWIVSLLLILVLAGPWGITIIHALTPQWTPEQIVQSQLDALQRNDMAGVYKYASPANKERTGSLDRFDAMVRSGPYRYLLGHQRNVMLLTSTTPVAWVTLVRIVPKTEDEKDVLEYWWSLSRCTTGEYSGCYMVDAVIPHL